MDGKLEYPLGEIVNPGEEVDFTILLNAPTTNGNHKSSWKLLSDTGVYFGVGQYDQAFYEVNSEGHTLLDDIVGDDPFTAYWMVDDANWNPNFDLMLPNPEEVPYPDFEDHLVFPVRVLKSPIELLPGDSLTIGVYSEDNSSGEVVLALAGMLWTTHCVELPEEEEVLGCKEQEACNYNPEATLDDGSCIFPGSPCDDGDACTIEDQLDENCQCAGIYLDSDGDGVCDLQEQPGCMDPGASNFDPAATDVIFCVSNSTTFWNVSRFAV